MIANFDFLRAGYNLAESVLLNTKESFHVKGLTAKMNDFYPHLPALSPLNGTEVVIGLEEPKQRRSQAPEFLQIESGVSKPDTLTKVERGLQPSSNEPKLICERPALVEVGNLRRKKSVGTPNFPKFSDGQPQNLLADITENRRGRYTLAPPNSRDMRHRRPTHNISESSDPEELLTEMRAEKSGLYQVCDAFVVLIATTIRAVYECLQNAHHFVNDPENE